MLVDSSVWIDLFADRDTAQTRALREQVVLRAPILVGDLIVTEVLQGTRHEREFALRQLELSLFDQVRIVDTASATQAARHYRHLRSIGITVRKTVDTLIATRCILDNIPLLFSDRDFLPFVEHLNLRSALDDTGLT
jgi:predicted nucleic acid-binding protein